MGAKRGSASHGNDLSDDACRSACGNLSRAYASAGLSGAGGSSGTCAGGGASSFVLSSRCPAGGDRSRDDRSAHVCRGNGFGGGRSPANIDCGSGSFGACGCSGPGGRPASPRFERLSPSSADLCHRGGSPSKSGSPRSGDLGHARMPRSQSSGASSAVATAFRAAPSGCSTFGEVLYANERWAHGTARRVSPMVFALEVNSDDRALTIAQRVHSERRSRSNSAHSLRGFSPRPPSPGFGGDVPGTASPRTPATPRRRQHSPGLQRSTASGSVGAARRARTPSAPGRFTAYPWDNVGCGSGTRGVGASPCGGGGGGAVAGCYFGYGDRATGVFSAPESPVLAPRNLEDDFGIADQIVGVYERCQIISQKLEELECPREAMRDAEAPTEATRDAAKEADKGPAREAAARAAGVVTPPRQAEAAPTMTPSSVASAPWSHPTGSAGSTSWCASPTAPLVSPPPLTSPDPRMPSSCTPPRRRRQPEHPTPTSQTSPDPRLPITSRGGSLGGAKPRTRSSPQAWSPITAASSSPATPQAKLESRFPGSCVIAPLPGAASAEATTPVVPPVEAQDRVGIGAKIPFVLPGRNRSGAPSESATTRPVTAATGVAPPTPTLAHTAPQASSQHAIPSARIKPLSPTALSAAMVSTTTNRSSGVKNGGGGDAVGGSETRGDAEARGSVGPRVVATGNSTPTTSHQRGYGKPAGQVKPAPTTSLTGGGAGGGGGGGAGRCAVTPTKARSKSPRMLRNQRSQGSYSTGGYSSRGAAAAASPCQRYVQQLRCLR
eukprot:TRINITY_DN68579_c0_g1_i1.p1 TRINITY_DN68579_c0_g1~~TRINITY_DN68579_c0_g1_i1.p1  ORF type:complete len:780 (-),score=102.84 TRINITY_DN68579_c0_g1_i1:586-2925(-)